jgi:hypothetical protein
MKAAVFFQSSKMVASGRERNEGVIILGSAGRCPKAGRLRFRIGAHVLGMDPISQRANPTLS